MNTDKDDNVYWNITSHPIFISMTVRPCEYGGPGEMEQKIIVMPGDGIDVSYLGLYKNKIGVKNEGTRLFGS